MDKTLNYYNENAKEYFDKTINVCMLKKYDKFLQRISKGCHILDLGCGSGRDSLYFIQNGYKVTSIEGSIELSKLATQYIGQPVKNINFINMEDVDIYDGIWACASLLHLKKEIFSKMLTKLYLSLKKTGVMYISLKIGTDFSTYEGNRFFTYYSRETLYQLLKKTNLNIIDEFVTSDGLNRDVEWINIIVQKN